MTSPRWLAALVIALAPAACVVVYTGEQRMLQPACLISCDATAARVEGSASAVVNQADESQGHASKREDRR